MPVRFAKRAMVGSLAVGIAASMIGVGTMRANAATEVLACSASGTVDVAPNAAGTGWDWSITGGGACPDVALPPPNTQIVNFTGSGTSDTLGLCSSSLVTNLDILVTVQLFDTVKRTTRTIQEHWDLAISMFPIAVPFLANKGTLGAGTMVTHIFTKCPPSGTDAADFVWAQVVA